MRRTAVLLAALAAAALGVQQAAAAPACGTTAVASGAWTAPATWDAGVPDASDHVCVPAGLTVTLSSGSATVLTVQAPGTLRVTGGSLTLTGTADDSEVATLELGGTIAGANTLKVTGAMTWTGGTMGGSGATRILSGATLTHSANYPVLDRPLDVEGTFALAADNRYVSGTGRIRNHDGGLIRRTAPGTGTAGLRVPVDNDGTLDATAGELELAQGGAGSSGDYGGGAGTVSFSGGAHELGDGARLLGGVELASGTVAVAGGATAEAAGANTMTGGTLAGPGSLTVTGTFDWSGGTMAGPGTTRVEAGGTLASTDYNALSDGRLVEVAGTLTMAADNRYVYASGSAPEIHNLPGGTIRRTVAGTGVAGLRVPVQNDGLLDSAAGELELTQGGAGSSGDFGGGAGTVTLGGGVHQLAAGAALEGNVELAAGELSVPSSSTVTAAGANAISGGIVSGPGDLEIAGTLTWSAGTMKGPGTTRVLAGGRIDNTGYTAVSEGRVIENAGLFALATDGRYLSRSGTEARFVNLDGGTVRRTAAGTSTASLRLPVDNDGTIDSAAGPLELAGGGSGTSSGSFGGGAGPTRLVGGAWTLEDGAQLRSGTTVAGNTTVAVPGGATVTATGATALAGTLDGAGTFAVGGAGSVLTWTQGSMTGTGVTSIGSGARLVLSGSVTLGGTRAIRAAGVVDSTGDHSLSPAAGADPVLHVQPGGTLRKSGGTGWSYVTVPVRNDGTVDGQSGELMLHRGAAEPHTGTFKGASATAHPVLSGTGHRLTAGVSLQDFTEIAGDVAVRESDTLTIADEVQQTGGELSGDVRVTGTLAWHGGSHELPGTTTIATGGTVAVTPEEGDACTSAGLGDGRPLVNDGTLRVSDGANLGGYGTPRAEIHSAGRIELDSAGDVCGAWTGLAGDMLVASTGTIEKLGDGSSYVGGTLDNDGLVLASDGTLRLESTSAAGQTGTFRSAGGAAIDLESGTFLLEAGAEVDGDLDLSGAELRLAEGVEVEIAAGDTLRQTGGTVSGDGELRVGGTLAWSGGEHAGAGVTSVAPGGTLAIAPPQDDDFAWASIEQDRSLVNRGAVMVRDATLSLQGGASMLNAGALELHDGAQLYGTGYGYGFASLLHNTGMLRKVGAAEVEAGVPIDNDGVIEVAGGTLDVPELVNWTGNGYWGDSGIAGGDYVVKGTLVVPGPITANGARIVLDGAGSRLLHGGSTTRTDALVALARNASGGELELRGGRSLTIAAAAETFVNAGVLALNPGSTLSAPAFRQLAGGVLRPGVASAASAGRIAVAGAAELGGRLDTPATAAVTGEVPVLTAARVSGAFASVTGAYEAIVTPTAVSLRRPGGMRPLPGPDGGETAGDGGPAPAPAPAPTSPVAGATRIGLAAFSPRGPWQRRGGFLVARERGARLLARRVRGRSLALVVRTCPRCGSVRVRWAGKARTVSLRSRRSGRRTVHVIRLRAARTATVRIRTTSDRRVAVAALAVSR
jgi:hypothetical protein